MSYYNTFLKSSKTPSEFHRTALQEFVDYEFDNASTYYTDVEEEIAFGTLKFKPCTVRINTIVDAKTGQRVNDDYKKIIFKDLTYSPRLGTRYRFNDNIWIVFSTDNTKTDTSSVYVRRCNNTINTQDKYGNIHKEPCYIDYKITETQPFRELRIDVPNGRIWVQCQYNEWTKNIDVNSRFMFGGNTYKLRERHKFDRTKTFEDSSIPTISFYADYDEIAPDDNIELEVANYKEYKYAITVPNEISGSVGNTGKINYSVSLDGTMIDEEVLFESTNEEILKVDSDGNYIMVGIGDCNIIVKLKNNNSFNTSAKVSVSDASIIIYKDVIEPEIRTIKINKTQNYTIYEYKNNTREDTKFDIKCYDVPEKNYLFETDGNNFSITNLKTTENYLLKVVCTNQRTLKENIIYIKLGGLF